MTCLVFLAGADPSIKNNLDLSPLDYAPHLMELYVKDVRSWLMDDYSKEEDSDRPQKKKARKSVKKEAKKPRQTPSQLVKRAASSSSSDSDSGSLDN
jgi:hypothetical protein